MVEKFVEDACDVEIKNNVHNIFSFVDSYDLSSLRLILMNSDKARDYLYDIVINGRDNKVCAICLYLLFKIFGADEKIEKIATTTKHQTSGKWLKIVSLSIAMN